MNAYERGGELGRTVVALGMVNYDARWDFVEEQRRSDGDIAAFKRGYIDGLTEGDQ